MFYEQIKAAAVSLHRSSSPTLPIYWTLCVAGAAGASAAWLTSPLDLVKTRLQVQRRAAALSNTGGTPFVYRSFVDGLREVAAKEGLRGMFKGSLARVLFVASTMSITVASMESFKQIYIERF